MFSEPVLRLDTPLLEQHLMQVQAKKERLLEQCIANKETLMSNPKLAELLISMGVEPPMKESPRTGKVTFAFAKNDEEFKELLNLKLIVNNGSESEILNQNVLEVNKNN